MPKGKQDKIRPVLVRFSNRHTRDSVYRARRKLSGSNNNGIYINEHLTILGMPPAQRTTKDLQHLDLAWYQLCQVLRNIKSEKDPH